METIKAALDATFSTPFFGIALTIACYSAGRRINARFRSVFSNPYLIAVILVVAVLRLTGIEFAAYERGGDVLSMMLVPATAILGTTIYSRRAFIRANLIPLMVGGFVGTATSMSSVWLMSRAFGIDEAIMMSMMPKSVTTPIAMELSALSGGIVSLSVMAVVCTGVFGTVTGPLLTRLFGVTDPITVGAAYGVSSHVIGTSKAAEIGETEAAASGVSICIAGLITVVLYMIFLI